MSPARARVWLHIFLLASLVTTSASAETILVDSSQHRRLAELSTVPVSSLEASSETQSQNLNIGAESDSNSNHFDSTIAGQLHKVLVKEFDENETVKGVASEGAGRSFDGTVRAGGGTLETVVRVTRTHDEGQHSTKLSYDSESSKPQGDDGLLREGSVHGDTMDHSGQDSLIGQLKDVSRGIDRVIRTGKTDAEDVERLVDSSDNEFVISNPKSGTMELQQDLQLIRDLVILFFSAAIGSTIFCLLGQPVITGYLLSGSFIGPGGLGVIVELVQVETLAQFGIIFLLFGLGLEFSAAKLRQVRGVAVLGGCLQIALMMLLCGVVSDVTGAGMKEGIFVGALLSMSSTAIAGKCIIEGGAINTLHGQITMGTLILQDCCVGLLFALVPVLAEGKNLGQSLFTLIGIFFKMGMFLGACFCLSRTLVQKMFRFASKQVPELFQIIAVAFCLAISLGSDQLGLSLEFGAFFAGVMISATPHAESTVENLHQIRNIFAALFMVSIGLIVNPFFLWIHADILLGSLLIIVTLKTSLVAIVVRAFGYSPGVCLTVGVSLAQIGEFSFVLLSRASNAGLVERKLYLLLLGTTALSLVITPTLIRGIPRILPVMGNFKAIHSDEIPQ
jgi:Kef-type K+ transport system membrane component KefB